MRKYPTLSLILLMVALISATQILLFITNKYILTVNFYERNGQPVSGIPDMETMVYEKIKSAIYLFSFIYVVAKIIVVSIILATGLYFFDIDVSFAAIFRMVILCEFIFLVPAAAKICWFWPDRQIVDLITWQNYYFLSASSFFQEIKPAFLLPLQTLNVFEVGYWFLLAGGIEKIASVRFNKALKVVLLSYLPALFIWEIFLVYFTIVYYPNSY